MISASWAASSASCGVAHSEWANRRTCGWDSVTTAVSEPRSPSWAVLIRRSSGQGYRSATVATPPLEQRHGADADQQCTDHDSDGDHHASFLPAAGGPGGRLRVREAGETEKDSAGRG